MEIKIATAPVLHDVTELQCAESDSSMRWCQFRHYFDKGPAKRGMWCILLDQPLGNSLVRLPECIASEVYGE